MHFANRSSSARRRAASVAAGATLGTGILGLSQLQADIVTLDISSISGQNAGLSQ